MRSFLAVRWMVVLLAVCMPLVCSAELSPLFNSETMMPLEQVQRGLRATGKSVFYGTEITEFNLEILGVLEGFNLGEAVIMARVLDGPVVERKTGIIGGMSGSPIYLEGKLIGAIAFSWPFSTEPIAGITTINSMLRAWEKQPAPPEEQVQRYPALGVELAGRWITRAQVQPDAVELFLDDHTIVLQPVSPLIYCSGFSPHILKGLGQFLRRWDLAPQAGPGAMRDPVATTLEPGSSFGVQLISGAFDMTAIGTVTYVEGDRLLALGHPLFKLGQVDFPLTTAWIHDIVPSLSSSNKLGSAMTRVGAMIQDTAWGAGALLGDESTTVPVQVQVHDTTSGLQHNYSFEVTQNEAFTPMLVLMGAESALEAGFDPGAYGMCGISFTVEGTKGARIERSNTHFFEGSPFYAVAGEMLSAAALLQYNIFQPQDLKSVHLTATLNNRDETALIERVYCEQAVAKAGEPLILHILLRPWGEELVEEIVKLDLPADMPATMLRVGVGGGDFARFLRRQLKLLTPELDSLEAMIAEFERVDRNNELLVLAADPQTGMSVGQVKLPHIPHALQSLLTASGHSYLSEGFAEIAVKRELPWVIFGGDLLTIPVEDRTGKRPEKRRPTPSKPGQGGPPLSSPLPPGIPMSASASVGGQEDFSLPEYPPTSLAWAASGLRHDLAARLQAALAAEGPPLPPELPPGMDEEFREMMEKVMEEAESAAEKLDLPEGEEEEPAEEVEEEGVGRVLRQPSEWVQKTEKDFAAGETEGTGISSEGGVFLPTAWKSTAPLPDGILLDATCAPDGSLYFSTADPGWVYRLAGDEAELFYQGEEFAIAALAARPDGTLIVGCTPNGKLLELSPEGKAQELCDLPATYIWDLQLAEDGTLYVATGPHGVIYQVSPGGEASVYAKLPESHVLALASRGSELLAATAQDGAVYLIDEQGYSYALLGAGENEVTSLAVDETGNVYAGTVPEGKVYRLTPEGKLRTVYEESKTPVYSLLCSPDGVYVGTGAEGKIFLIRDPDHSASVLIKAQVKFVSRLVAAPDGQAYALTNCPGGLMTTALNGLREGTFVSSVLEAERKSTWGKATWSGKVPEGSTVELQCRSGNTEDPEDGSWTGWSRIYQPGEALDLPAGRYLQYRLRLQAPAGVASPEVSRVTITYLPANQRPEADFSDPDPGAAICGEVTVSWETEDKDKDKLTSRLYLRRRGQEQWEELAGPLTEDEYEWDTTELEPGHYELRLVVSDRRSNPTGWLEYEKTLSNLLVDNEAPAVVLRLVEFGEEAAPGVAGSVADSGSGLVSVAWKSANDEEADDAVWTAAVPNRQVFTLPVLSFIIPAEQIPADTEALVVRAIDAAGNYTDEEIRLVEEVEAEG